MAQQQTTPLPLSFHNPRAYLAGLTTLTDDSWFPDSRTTHHLAHYHNSLLTSSECNGFEQVLIGHGIGIIIRHVGNAI